MNPKILSKQTAIFLLLFLLCSILLTSISLQAQIAQPSLQEPQSRSSNASPSANRFSNANITYKIIDASDKTFGYNIYADGRLMIHQPSIPALQGKRVLKPKPRGKRLRNLL